MRDEAGVSLVPTPVCDGHLTAGLFPGQAMGVVRFCRGQKEEKLVLYAAPLPV